MQRPTDIFPSGNGAHEAPYNLGFGLHANDAIDFLAGLQDQERGNTLDPESFGCERIVIDVHSRELNPPRHLGGKLIENLSDRAARTTPGCPHVQQYGEGRAFDL
jgi:hypothetical protein